MRTRGLLVAGLLNAAGAAFGAGFSELEIYPGNGVATNVAAIGGAVNVTVNPGASGGGIVTLSGANTYYGSTTLGCGTLVAESLADGFSACSIGTSSASVSNLVLRNGTLLYQGVPVSTDHGYTVSVDPAKANYAAVLQADGDITFRGNVSTLCGNFIKSGTGTVAYASAGSNQFSRGASSGLNSVIDFKANGDSPTVGYSGFNVTAGKVVFGLNAGQTNYFTAEMVVGLPTTTVAGKETEAYVDFVGGMNYLGDWLGIGRGNGTTTTAPAGLSSRVTIYNGYVRVSNLSMGYSANISGYNARPVLDLFGGALDIVSAMRIGDHAGGHPTLNLYGGTAKAASYISGIYGATDARINMYSNAVLEITGSCNLASNSGTVCTLALHGGTFKARGVFARPSGATAKVYFNGGRFMARASGGEGIGASVQAVVSTNGACFDTQSYTFLVYPPLAHDAALGEAADAGLVKNGSGTLVLVATNTYTGPTLLSNGVLSVNGKLPAATALSVLPGARLALTNGLAAQTVGSLTFGAANTVTSWDLALAASGGTSGKLTVSGTLTAAGANPLKVWFYTAGTGAGVSANGTYTLMEYPTACAGAINPLSVVIGNPVSGKLYTFGTVDSGANTLLQVTVGDGPAGDVWINAAGGAWTTGSNWQGGTPVNAAGAVATFSTEAQAGGATVTVSDTVTLGGASVSSANAYTVSGGTLVFNNGGLDAAWSVTSGSHEIASAVQLDGLAALATVAGTTQAVSGAVSGNAGLRINPAASGGGTVMLSGANTFAGGVATGSGTAEFESTGALGSASGDALSLILGPGTLRYTGASTSWAGFTLQAGSGKAAILDSDSDIAVTEAILHASGSFIKSGTGTLSLQGDGSFTLGSDSTSWMTNALGLPANGDSPANSFGACNVAEGKMVWGESGQSVTIKNHLLVGIKTTTNAGAEVTGEVEINGGETTLTSGDVYIGVYNGTPLTAPVPLHPRLTLNDGALSAKNIVLGWDNRFTSAGYLASNDVMNTQPELIVNGGTVSASGIIYVSYHGSLGSTNRFVLNGGTVSAKALYYGESASPASAASVEINGGSLLLQEDFRVARYLAESWLYLNGGLLRAFDIQKAGGDGYAHIFFNGGTFQPIPYPNVSTWNSDYGTLQNLSNVWVQAGGFVLDTSFCPTGYNYTVQQAMKHDPALGGTPDGGLVKKGEGQVIIRPVTKGGYDFTGPVRAEAGILGIENAALCGNAVILHEGAALRASNATAWQWVNSLTLGTNTAEVGSVLLDLSASSGRTSPIAVSNALSIVSDVEVCMHPNGSASYVWSMPVGGAYTVLVCRADQALDVAKFKGAARFTNRTASFEKVTIADGGAYDGWQAIVMGVADSGPANEAVWDATSGGGAWETAANWQADTVPADQASQRVLFTNAASASVPVTLADAKTLGQVTLQSEAGRGYSLSGGALSFAVLDTDSALVNVPAGTHAIAAAVQQGSQTLFINCRSNAAVEVSGAISGANALALNAATVGGGTTVLSGPNTYTGGTTVRSGKVVVGALANGGQPSPVGASSAANANLVVGPGTLHYTGPDVAVDRGLQPNPGGSYVAILRNDHDLTLSGVFSSTAGAVAKLGPGTLRLACPGTNKLSAAGSGNINATAAWPVNGDSPPGMGAGFLVDEGKLVLGGPGQVVTVGGEAVIGAQDRGLGSPTYTCSMDILGGQVIFSGYLSIGRNFKRTTGVDTYPTLNIYDGDVSAGYLTMAYDTIWKAHSTKAVLNLYGGTFTVADQFRLGHHKGDASNPPRATVNVYAGVLNHPSTSQGMTFGWLNAGDPSPSCAGVLNVFGGLVNERWLLKMANNDSKSWANLHGGILRAENITHVSGSAGESHVFFNGGIYQPMGSNSAQRVLQGLTEAVVSTNGALFDTSYLAAGAIYTNAQVLTHDAALGAVQDGGLSKLGNGMLALAVSNAFTGPVTVQQGVLRLAHNAAIPDLVNVTGSGVLDADGAVRDVPQLIGTGVCSNGTVRVTQRVNPGAETNAPAGATLTFHSLRFAPGATFDCASTTNGLPSGTNDLLAVCGDVTAEGNGYIDFGRTEENPLSFPYSAVVMTYETCGTTFAGWRARGTGYPSGVVAMRVTRDESGPVKVVRVELVRGGTAILIR